LLSVSILSLDPSSSFFDIFPSPYLKIEIKEN
jgi:hypothetical protein